MPRASSSASRSARAGSSCSHGSVVDELVRSGSGLAIEVAPSGGTATPSGPTDWLSSVPRTPGPYLEGTLTTAVATAIGVVIDRQIVLPNISLVFVVPVLVAAARHGLVPSLWVSALSVLAFNFFFLPPLYQFTIRDPANVVALFFFMFVAIAASALAARTRSQTEAARREARTTAELYAFSRKIAGVMDLYDLLWIVVTHLARLLNAEVVILMPRGAAGWSASAAFPPDSEFSDADLAAARWSWDADQPTGRGTDTLPGGALAVRADPHRPLADRRDRRAADHGGTRADHRRPPAARRGGQPGRRRHRARDAWPPTSTRRGSAPSASACARPC